MSDRTHRPRHERPRKHKASLVHEKGKTYVFSYKVRNSKKTGLNSTYQVLSLTNNATTENSAAPLLGLGKAVNGDATVTDDGSWSTNTVAFTNTDGYAYALFSARWLASTACFDDFYLVEAEEVTDNSATLLKQMQETEADAERTTPDAGTATVYGNASTQSQGNGALLCLADNDILNADLSALTAQGITLTNPQANANLIVTGSPIDIENAILVDNGVLRSGSQLTDGAPLNVTTNLQGTISYTRTINNGNEYGTLLLPFAVSSTDRIQFYGLQSAQNDVLYFEALGEVPANTPAMYHTDLQEFTYENEGIAATTPQAIGDYFTGTYRTITAVPEGSYVLSKGQYWQVDSNVSLAPFRAYLHTLPTTAGGSVRMKIDLSYTSMVSTPVDNTDALRILSGKGGVRIVAGAHGNTLRLYSIGGQLLRTATLAPQEGTTLPLPAGTYIVNGTKIVVY
jgi:hypothetical protein